MILDRLLKPRPAKVAGGRLYSGAVAQARLAPLYLTFGVRDSLEGRFELFSLHVVLLLERLKGQGALAEETSQAVFDAYVRGLDDAFREIGVSDTAVGKKMKKLAGAFYGRLKAFDEVIAKLPDSQALSELLGRTALEERGDGDIAGLTAYVLKAREGLAGQSLAQLLEGEAKWPNL